MLVLNCPQATLPVYLFYQLCVDFSVFITVSFNIWDTLNLPAVSVQCIMLAGVQQIANNEIIWNNKTIPHVKTPA